MLVSTSVVAFVGRSKICKLSSLKLIFPLHNILSSLAIEIHFDFNSNIQGIASFNFSEEVIQETGEMLEVLIFSPFISLKGSLKRYFDKYVQDFDYNLWTKDT